jgi:hypothetical protein
MSKGIEAINEDLMTFDKIFIKDPRQDVKILTALGLD